MFRIDKRLVNMADSPSGHSAEGASESYDHEKTEALLAEELESAREQARQIIEDAKEQAGQLIQEAEAQASELYESAQSSGYADGMEAGMRCAREELDAQLAKDAETVGRLVAEIEDERARILDGLEAEIVEMTLSMIKKIINISEERDDKIFESMIAKALTQIKPEGKVTVRVSSAEYEKYFSSGSAAFSVGGEMVNVPVLQDPALGSWDCVIDSGSGTADAGLDSQLEHMRKAFDEAGAL